MKKKTCKAIRAMAADLPGMVSTHHRQFGKDYEVEVNHYRRMKRAFKRNGMDAVKLYLEKVYKQVSKSKTSSVKSEESAKSAKSAWLVAILLCLCSLGNAQIEMSTDSVIAYVSTQIDSCYVDGSGNGDRLRMPSIWARKDGKHSPHHFYVNQRASMLIDTYNFKADYYPLVYHSSYDYLLRFTHKDMVIDVNTQNGTVSYIWPQKGEMLIYK